MHDSADVAWLKTFVSEGGSQNHSVVFVNHVGRILEAGHKRFVHWLDRVG